MSLKEKFKKAEDIVMHCLKKYPKTRSSDRELLRRVWEVQGYKLPKKTLHLYFMVMSPETCRRSRQKIQAMGLFRPDEKTRQKRLDYAEDHRLHHKKTGRYVGGLYVIE